MLPHRVRVVNGRRDGRCHDPTTEPPNATSWAGDVPLIRQPEFRALLGARGTNALAGSALATVVAFQTYDITRDPLALGWLGLVEAIPALSLVLFGGHVADRRDRRSIVLLDERRVMACAALLAVLSAQPAGSGCRRSSRSSSPPASPAGSSGRR